MKKLVPYLLPFVFFLTYCDKGSDENSNWTEADQAYYEHILDLQNEGSENLTSWMQTMDSLDAVDHLLQFFLADTSVESAILGSQGISIDYKNGMRGGIMLNPEDFPDEEKNAYQGGSADENIPDGLKSMVNNNKMIFMNPTYWERWDRTDNAIDENSEDLKRINYDLKTIYKDRDANLDRFCDLGGYGIIRIYSHGWAHPTKWNIVETYVQTGESASDAATKKYGDDIKASKIIIVNVKNVNSQVVPSPVYFVSKDFITGHNDFSKDTVFFYGGFCFSFTGTWPLIEESFAKATYMGFSWRVRTGFNCNLGNAAIDYLTDTAGTPPKTAGQFMAEPEPVKEMWDDEDQVMCRLRYSGDPDLTLWSKTMVTTNAVTDIDSVSATCGGTVTASASTVIEARGVCWSKNTSPTIDDYSTNDGSGTGSFTSELDDLTPATPYYVRAYAKIKNGQTIYGNEVSFTTADPGGTGSPCPGLPTFTDSRDGQVYPTVQIGSQCWMKKNLNYATGNSWCYNDNDANCTVYGRLYDWYTALDACPSGWHLPSDDEWFTLTGYLGGDVVAGGAMKETGTVHWNEPNPASNSSGFTALPGGGRESDGAYDNLGNAAFFNSSTSYTNNESWAWTRALISGNTVAGRAAMPKSLGQSVRCVKN